MLEGQIPQNLENSKFSRKQTNKKKNKEEKKHNEKTEKSIGKGSKKMEGRVDFDDKLSPNEYTAIYGGNLKRSEDQTRFSFFNLDENRQLLVPEKKKVYLRNLTRFQLEMSYFRISRINLSRGSRFNPIGFYNRKYFHAKLFVQFFLFKTTILETQLYNVYSENISVFFFFFQHPKILFNRRLHCFENLSRVSGGIRCSLSNRPQEDESEERREIELLPRGFDQTYAG